MSLHDCTDGRDLERQENKQKKVDSQKNLSILKVQHVYCIELNRKAEFCQTAGQNKVGLLHTGSWIFAIQAE